MPPTLKEIRPFLKRAAIHALLYVLCLAIFGLVVFVIGPWAVGGEIDQRLVGLTMIGLLAVVAMVRPLDQLLTRLINRSLSRDRQRYQKTLKAATAGMVRIRNLSRLLTLINHVIVRNVGVIHATIFLKSRENASFVVAASDGKIESPAGLLRLDEGNPLVDWLSQNEQPTVYEELKARLKKSRRIGQSQEIKRIPLVMNEMERRSAVVCVPSFIEGGLKGFLLLGKKLSGAKYEPEDLNLFSALASQAALAIENAEAYEELRDTRDQLLQSERLATIGKFAADMAHEIKNPLQAIKTFFEYLPTRYNNQEFREEFSQIAKAEVDRIDDLVRQLANFTHPKPPQFKPVEMHQVIDSVLALLEKDLHKHHIEVRKGYSPNGLTVEADRDQMKQVFLNLCTNAIEAMEPAEEKNKLLEIVAYPASQVLVAKVRDTGCGIPQNQVADVFTPSFTTKEKGSGLGLSIVKNILRAHCATIEVESQLGQGTTFTITLPRRQPGMNLSSQAV